MKPSSGSVALPEAPGGPRPKRLRLAIRTTLAGGERDRFGCTTEDCTCPRHFRLDGLPDPDVAWLRRLRFIVKVESLINIGCTFGPNDLDPVIWDELLMLAQERQWMDRATQAFREWLGGQQKVEHDAHTKLRREAGIPAPGQSIFGPSPKKRR